VNVCRFESVATHDLDTFLTHIQLEYARQQMTYSTLMNYCQSFAESYSNSLFELHSLERELNHVFAISNSSARRMPEEVRRRLHELMTLCRTFSHNRRALDELFGNTMNYKFYNQMKEMLKTRNFVNRRQSLTAIIQMHKHFLHTSQNYGQSILAVQQIDDIIRTMTDECPKDHHRIEMAFKRMAELGHLQVRAMFPLND
jgi:DNA repair ATPase RecN